MKDKKITLSKQLLSVVGISSLLLFISLGSILPRIITPVAEKNIYNYLKEPLNIYNNTNDNKLSDTEIAYIYLQDSNISTSSNINDVIRNVDTKKLLKLINNDYGKITYNHKIYYYYTLKNSVITKIAISNDNYLKQTKASIINAIFPLILQTAIIIGLMLILWSTLVVKKIEKLKSKIDNIDNPNFKHNIDFTIDDEIKSLSLALENMRLSLINQEKYKNQMYQNISHDFKTPLAVIKSHIEAVEDEIEDTKKAFPIIKEQTNKLSEKVNSLLYLNKLDYLRNEKKPRELINMTELLEKEVEKFKYNRKDIIFKLNTDKKSKYYGSYDYWETILDNILSNFIRYSKTKIEITTKQNKIILYNDGPNISDDFLQVIFTPYRKGIKGEFGLGLSIVKKSLDIMDYDITIKNEKVGVSFIITKKKKTK